MIKRTMIVLTLVFLSVAVVFGQAEQTDRQKYQANVIKSLNDLRGKIYRSVTITETFTDLDSKAVKSSKRIYEIFPPDRMRLILESEGERSESIQIGERRFIKINDGEWKADKGSSLGYGIGSSAEILSESYKIEENTTLNERVVRFYERRERLKNSSGNSQSQSEIWRTSRFWITKDGVLLRTQNETEKVGSKEATRTTTDYEYNPKDLKIEAPIK